MILQDLIKDFTINLAKVKQEHVSIILNYDETLEVFKLATKDLKKLESGLTDMVNAIKVFNSIKGE